MTHTRVVGIALALVAGLNVAGWTISIATTSGDQKLPITQGGIDARSLSAGAAASVAQTATSSVRRAPAYAYPPAPQR